jgi:hypothetical protein
MSGTTPLVVRGYSLSAGPSFYEFRPYRYGGDIPLDKDPDAHYGRTPKPKPEPKPVRHEFSPDKCGTPAGHQRHLYWKVPICEACREAKNEYWKIRKAAIRARKGACNASSSS